jgi:tripartite-type tricarboxylate transporter receptor subunit TctC
MIRLLASLALVALASIGAQAQNYPARTVTVIVPFAAGGPADITGRIVADIFARHLGQQFVVENVGGAGGTTGSLRGARAAPDGYTLNLGHMGTHAAAPALYPNLGYDPEKGVEPIGLIAEQPELLTVRKDFPANNLKEFVAYAKANESKLNMGHAGVGSVSYVGCLLLNSAIGIKPTLVPFTGTAPVMNAILAGTVDYDCDPVLGPLPHVQAGTAKALAIATRKAQSAAAQRADVLRAGPARVRLRAVLCGVCAQGYTEGDRRQAGGRSQQGAGRAGRAKAPGRPRRRHRRAEAPRTEGAGRAGQERGRAAHADPEGREREVVTSRQSPSPRRTPPAPRAAGRSGGGIP